MDTRKKEIRNKNQSQEARILRTLVQGKREPGELKHKNGLRNAEALESGGKGY